jgi:hypothetical protein
MVQKMFKRLRHFNDRNSEKYTVSAYFQNPLRDSETTFILQYPSTCGSFKIRKIRDVTAGVFIDLETGATSKPVSDSSNAFPP